MRSFRFSPTALDSGALAQALADPACGGFSSFEGWVRNHNEGQEVVRLEYEAFEALALKEGERILAEAAQRFGVANAACVHRVGALAIGEMAVWVGVSAPHRDEAFRACRYIIDEVKHRVPIWKKEHYRSGDSGWVNCERCAADAPAHDHGSAGHHGARHPHGAEHPHGEPVVAGSGRAATPRPDYSRQMALSAVGERGQARLRAASVLVVGAGGLGVPVLSLLAGAGVGRLGIVDGDTLEATNLHRQTMYSIADCGEPKATLAAARIAALNPDVRTHVHVGRLEASNAEELAREYDLLVDCSDNFSTKFLLNDVAQRLAKPLVLASVYQYEGQLQVVRGDRAGACLRCIWPEATRDGLVGNCAEAGVLGPVPAVFGSLQALEALKVLLDLPGQLRDEVLVLDLTTLAASRVRARRAAACEGRACVQLQRAAAVAAADHALELLFDSLDEALEAGYEIVDVREPRELAELPTPAARARQLPLASLLRDATALERSQRYLVVCARGARSLAATRELRARGFERAFSLRGGVLGLALKA